MTSADISYPPPDTTIREYFIATEIEIVTRHDLAARYASFFRALFDAAYALFCPNVKTAGDLRQQLLIGRPERQRFYEDVVTKANSNRKEDTGLHVRRSCNARTPAH